MLVKSTVKYIQTLGQKKFREEEGMFIAEGPKIVKELLEESNVNVTALFALQDWINNNKKLIGATAITKITETELEKISQFTGEQGEE